MTNSQHVLVLDDEAGFRQEIQEFLEREGHTVYPAEKPSRAREILDSFPVDIAIFDIRLPEMDGLTLLKEVKEMHAGLEVIMMTGFGTMDRVVEALRCGANDFLNKPFQLSEIRTIINKISRYRNVRKHFNETLTDYDRLLENGAKLEGESAEIERLKDLIRKVAGAGDTTVLITGESGTGKELVARSIHHLSDRKAHRFIPVNCSSIPDELFENEFFGHVKGSYTDARSDQKGLFETAHKGTLFLDEIGDLKFSMQAKLLRVIEEKRISRIGHYEEKEVDVRIIAATNQNIEQMVARQEFRQDLYYRLNLFRMDIPPLRERKGDIPVLFSYFVETLSKRFGKSIVKVEKSIAEKLSGYDFPGNVRELKNMVERAVILSEGNILKEKHFSNLSLLASECGDSSGMTFTNLDLAVIEKNSILQALKDAGNNKSRAARFLHISRQALDRKIEKYAIICK